jgi:hypothetical protein
MANLNDEFDFGNIGTIGETSSSNTNENDKIISLLEGLDKKMDILLSNNKIEEKNENVVEEIKLPETPVAATEETINNLDASQEFDIDKIMANNLNFPSNEDIVQNENASIPEQPVESKPEEIDSLEETAGFSPVNINTITVDDLIQSNKEEEPVVPVVDEVAPIIEEQKPESSVVIPIEDLLNKETNATTPVDTTPIESIETISSEPVTPVAPVQEPVQPVQPTPVVPLDSVSSPSPQPVVTPIQEPTVETIKEDPIVAATEDKKYTVVTDLYGPSLRMNKVNTGETPHRVFSSEKLNGILDKKQAKKELVMNDIAA